MEIKDSIEDFKEYIDSISRELNNKVENINSRFLFEKTSQVKDKAITVLNRAYNKVVDLSKELSEKDIELLLKHAYKKSKLLYADATNKIDAYIAEYSKDEDFDQKNDDDTKLEQKNIENKVNAIVDNILKEESKSIENAVQVIDKPQAKEVVEKPVAEKAVFTLKEWLNPER